MKTTDSMYMDIVKVVGNNSKAKKLKVGAIAVRDGNILGIGINGTPTGWYTNEDMDENGRTHDTVLHAEENLVSKLARQGSASDGATLYCTHAPCVKCSRLIYQSGFSRVVYGEDYRKTEGIELMSKMGIDVSKYQ